MINADSMLMQRPARVAVRLIALAQLGAAEDARRIWKESRDPEALHDFRVALRRLRCGLRAYAVWFADSLGDAERRRWKTLARATGASRDYDVQLQQLRAIEPDAADADALQWLIAAIEMSKQDANAISLRALDVGFPRERARLERRLTRYTGTIDPADPDASEPALAFAAAGLITVLGAELEARLAAVRTERHQREAHRARIAGKRLRYVLEPLRPALPRLAGIIQRLKGLQDVLGDMHDADVLHQTIEARIVDGAATAPEAGLRSLQDRIALRRSALFDDFHTSWSVAAAPAFFDDIRRAARELRNHAVGGVEIERKYLLDSLPRMGRRVPRARIDQGWIPGTRLQERVRRVREGRDTRWYRTVKSGRGLRRIEIEEETSRPIFDRLWRLTLGHRVHKRRYTREDDGLLWEIDQFLDRDLILAEVELATTDAEVRIPAWLEPHIVREVTGEDAYVNVNLAK